ncbi:hypothetical protein N9L92_03865 [Saprospiraceae bacterium]|nr:hypothetical protein [Saprospiraceae bacterium]
MKTYNKSTTKFSINNLMKFSLLFSFCLLAMVGTSQDYEINKTPGGAYAIFQGNNGANTLIEGGHNLTTGFSNTVIGTDAGDALTTGEENTFVGKQAGFLNTGDRNTYVGSATGRAASTTGSDNVFIGFKAGLFESGSDKLHISNNNHTLIQGDFAAETLSVNGDLTVVDILRLTPTNADPGCSTVSDLGKLWMTGAGGGGAMLKVCRGTLGWQDLF